MTPEKRKFNKRVKANARKVRKDRSGASNHNFANQMFSQIKRSGVNPFKKVKIKK